MKHDKIGKKAGTASPQNISNLKAGEQVFEHPEK